MSTTTVRRLGRVSRRLRAHDGPAGYRSADAAAAEQAPASTPAPRAMERTDTILRAALVSGAFAAAAIAWLVATGESHPAEPELALLLRGMATFKGLVAVAAAAFVWWRLGKPISAGAAFTYRNQVQTRRSGVPDAVINDVVPGLEPRPDTAAFSDIALPSAAADLMDPDDGNRTLVDFCCALVRLHRPPF